MMVDFDFNQLRELEDNWNSYGSPKPNERSIEQAAFILGHLIKLQLEPKRILASAEGGVALIFAGVDIRRALIEVLNDGEITTLLYDMDGFSATTIWKGCTEKAAQTAVFGIKTWLFQV